MEAGAKGRLGVFVVVTHATTPCPDMLPCVSTSPTGSKSNLMRLRAGRDRAGDWRPLTLSRGADRRYAQRGFFGPAAGSSFAERPDQSANSVTSIAVAEMSREDLGCPAGRRVDLQDEPPARTCARPIDCSSVLAPKLLPEETCRWMACGLNPTSRP